MNNITTAQITEAQKKAISRMLEAIDDPTTIHKVWAILNRRYSQQQKGGEVA